MFRDLFDKGKCALGFHAGEWRYVAPRSCDQLRICTRCRNESRQVVHTWEEWQRLSPGRCEFSRHCSRCTASETKTEHTWGAAIYPEAGSCALVQPCTGCANTKPAGTAHIFDAWSYDAADACGQTSVCSRCQTAGSARRIEHEWNPWIASEFYAAPVHVCRRCAEMAFDLTGEGATVSMQSAAAAVTAAIASADAASLRNTVQKNRQVLLGPVAERYLAYAADQLSPTPDVRKTYQDFASVLTMCRTDGLDAVFGPAATVGPATASDAGAVGRQRAPTGANRTQRVPPGASGALDSALVGHWRHTEPVSGFTTDTHCLFDDTGRFKWWSKSVSQFGVSTADAEYGTWHVAGGLLHLVFEDGTHMQRDYITERGSMVWRNDGRYRFWSHP
jgi:hypothetical protein